MGAAGDGVVMVAVGGLNGVSVIGGHDHQPMCGIKHT